VVVVVVLAAATTVAVAVAAHRVAAVVVGAEQADKPSAVFAALGGVKCAVLPLGQISFKANELT
jgi:hypothetical protein